MESRIKKAMTEVTTLLDFAAFEDPDEWKERVAEAKEDGLEEPTPGDCTGWGAPCSWQVDEESEIRYNEETDEIELAMRYMNACSCCANKPMYLQWMTVPELVEALKKREWIVFVDCSTEDTDGVIAKLEAFHEKFKNS